jgi:hypothetical protein
VPNKNYNQDVLNSHLLKLAKKFLSAPFFCSVFIAFSNKTFICTFLVLIGRSILWNSVSKYRCFWRLRLSALL